MRTKTAGSFIRILLVVVFSAAAESPRTVSAGGGGGPLTPLPNVMWTFTDSVAGCPAGDSVGPGHPARLRFLIIYRDADELPKSKVPPESIWVTFAPQSGSNVQVTDQIPTKIYVDDSTRSGSARISFPSVSGCGRLNVTLFVSGVSQGTKLVTIRTTDSLLVGRITPADTVHVCDLNYDGAVTSADRALARQHLKHWHRQALHGGMMRRTNYCETCKPETVNTRGESAVSWSPNGRHVAYTAFIPYKPPICHFVPDTAGDSVLQCDSIACKVFIVPSDPIDGSAVRQITSVPTYRHDYDPMWSPDNRYLLFDRGDSVIIRKGILGFGADTTDASLTSSSCVGASGNTEGDVTPAISMDQKWVAFSRCNPTGGHNIWKVPFAGGTPQRVTPNTNATE